MTKHATSWSQESRAKQRANTLGRQRNYTCDSCGKTMYCSEGGFGSHKLWCNPANPIARFWAKVDKRGPDECWPWQGQVRWDGYGRFVTMRKPQWTHRFSWELHNGRKLVKGEKVLHSCGNALCCNHAHLSLGTQAENMADPKRLERWRESLAIAQDVK